MGVALNLASVLTAEVGPITVAFSAKLNKAWDFKLGLLVPKSLD